MSLTQGIHRAVQLWPERTALVDGDLRYTWKQHAERVARLAGALLERGLSSGDRVAMLGQNSAAMIEYYFAVLWAGGVLVPVNTRWSAEEVRHCLEDSDPLIVMWEAELADLAEQAMALSTKTYKTLPADQIDAAIADATPAEDRRRSGSDLAALFYTGGTTGRSKGVMLSHDNLIANAMNAMANMKISGDTVHLHTSPLFHVAGGSRPFTIALVGGTHVMLRSFEPESFLAIIERERVTLTIVVPTMLRRLLAASSLGSADLSSLGLLSYGASPMPEALLRDAMQKMPGVAFLQSYGMTELSPVATVLEPRFHVFEGADAGRTASAGRAVVGADVAIVDADGRHLSYGEVGEVCVRGPMVMQGYWRNEAATIEAVVDGWMHTGDVGYLDTDGFLFLVDRAKDMIVTGGENVYSSEVESALYEHPNVHECAVIGIPDEQWGEAVHAVVVAKSATQFDADEVIAFCQQRIARYKCPKSITVHDAELPKSGAGKILKTELRKPFWSGSQRSIN